MAIHNFGPVYHSESPTSMNMTGWVDDDGNYSITFATNFANGESYNYPWTIYIGTDSSNPVMEIPKDEIGSNANYTKTCTGKISETHFYAWAHCGCDGCANNTSPLVIADINLYSAPTLGDIQIVNTTTKSITVKATWSNTNNNTSVSIELYNDNNLISTLIQHLSDGSDPVVFDNLNHNSNYIIKASLSDGITTLNYPNIETKTKKLNCIVKNSNIHQYSSIIDFITTIDDDENYNQSGIIRSDCKLLDKDGNIINNSSISFEDNNDKPANSRVTISNLNSYTEYNVKYYISDGFNNINCIFNFTTIFPYIRININGEYKKAIPYIYTNNEWHKAKGFKNKQEFNGE